MPPKRNDEALSQGEPPALCFVLRDVLLQVARNFEQCASKEKVKHGEGHMPDPMPLTNVSNSISPNGSDFCRPMPMIYGEKTF